MNSGAARNKTAAALPLLRVKAVIHASDDWLVGESERPTCFGRQKGTAARFH
jgi:hypothetical protein